MVQKKETRAFPKQLKRSILAERTVVKPSKHADRCWEKRTIAEDGKGELNSKRHQATTKNSTRTVNKPTGSRTEKQG